MNSAHDTLTVGGFQVSPEMFLPLTIAILIGAMLMFGVRRELATFAIAAGVIGAILMS